MLEDDEDSDDEFEAVSVVVATVAATVAAFFIDSSAFVAAMVMLSITSQKDNMSLSEVLAFYQREGPVVSDDPRTLTHTAAIQLFGLCPFGLLRVEELVLPIYNERYGRNRGRPHLLPPRSVLYLTLRKLRTGVTNRVLMYLGVSESMVSRCIACMLPCLREGLYETYWPGVPSAEEQEWLHEVQVRKRPRLHPLALVWAWVDGVRLHIERAFDDRRWSKTPDGRLIFKDGFFNVYVKGCTVNCVLVGDSVGRFVAVSLNVNGRSHDSAIFETMMPDLRRLVRRDLFIGGDYGFVKGAFSDVVVTAARLRDHLAAQATRLGLSQQDLATRGWSIPAAPVSADDADDLVTEFNSSRQAPEHHNGSFTSTWRVLRVPLPADGTKRGLILDVCVLLQGVRWAVTRQVEELTLALNAGAVAPRYPEGVWYERANPREFRIARLAYMKAHMLQSMRILPPSASYISLVAARTAHVFISAHRLDPMPPIEEVHRTLLAVDRALGEMRRRALGSARAHPDPQPDLSSADELPLLSRDDYLPVFQDE